MHDSSLNMSTLMATWVTAVLYGINIVLFICCIRVLCHRKLVGLNRVLLILSTIQFTLSTGHNITCLIQIIKGFITNGATPDGPLTYFIDMATTEHILQEAFYITNSIIGDGILVWRLHIVWNHNWWLSAPLSTLVTATAVCGYTATAHLVQFSPVDPVFAKSLSRWILSLWSMSLVTQVSATLLIAYKIWSNTFHGTMRRSGPSAVFWMVVESGAVYSITTVITMTLYVLKADSGAISGGALGQISSLIPMSIIVRIGFLDYSTTNSLPSFRATRPPNRSEGSVGPTFGGDNSTMVRMQMTSVEDASLAGDTSKDLTVL